MTTKLDKKTSSKSSEEVKEPPKFKIIFINDDFTSMEFVIYVLRTIFHHDEASAYKIMMNVHINGKGVAGVFSKEIAETKREQTLSLARKEEFPLEVLIEAE